MECSESAAVCLFPYRFRQTHLWMVEQKGLTRFNGGSRSFRRKKGTWCVLCNNIISWMKSRAGNFKLRLQTGSRVGKRLEC
uniref:Uncharacterized protein n=1 Tax=Kalanchoe fedtschenkoi TaxID=63787 RepID=A0A7N0UI77_KALFE